MSPNDNKYKFPLPHFKLTYVHLKLLTIQQFDQYKIQISYFFEPPCIYWLILNAYKKNMCTPKVLNSYTHIEMCIQMSKIL